MGEKVRKRVADGPLAVGFSLLQDGLAWAGFGILMCSVLAAA